MDEIIWITRGQLIAALRIWDADSKSGNWQPRDDDDERHADSADYLLELMAKG